MTNYTSPQYYVTAGTYYNNNQPTSWDVYIYNAKTRLPQRSTLRSFVDITLAAQYARQLCHKHSIQAMGPSMLDPTYYLRHDTTFIDQVTPILADTPTFHPTL